MEEDLLNNDGPLIPTGEIGINKENSMVVINKKHKYNSEKKYGKNQDLSSKRLESMGFSKTRYDASGSNTNLGKNDTRIIYPSDMQPGESLPVVIMVPGDSQNSNFRNGYFNNYEKVNGEDLPRAVYVVAGPHMKETMEDNAYKDVSEFLATKGVGISQIGVEAFSGGGGAGMIVAVCAADDNKDTPVLLLLNKIGS